MKINKKSYAAASSDSLISVPKFRKSVSRSFLRIKKAKISKLSEIDSFIGK